MARLIFPDDAEVTTGQEVSVVPLATIHIALEHRDHVFVSIWVQMVDLVAFVEHISHHHRRWCVYNRRAHHVGHVPMIVVLGNAQLFVAVELTDSTQMHIATQDGDTHALLSS